MQFEKVKTIYRFHRLAFDRGAVALNVSTARRKTMAKRFLSLLSFIEKKKKTRTARIVILKGGFSLSFVREEATFSFAILYTITSQTYLRLSSRLHQFKCSNMSPTVDVFYCLSVINIAIN